MNEATGPTYEQNVEELKIGDANHVQETLAIIGTTTAYSLLGYVPAAARSVLIFEDGALLVQGTDYNIDGRKIAYTAAKTGSEVMVASYITTNEVASIPAVTIDFDIPGQDVRVGENGNFQVLISGTWYDMVGQTDPITGTLSFVVTQTASPNQ